MSNGSELNKEDQMDEDNGTENVEGNSDYCSMVGLDKVSINSMPFADEDLYVKKAMNDIKIVLKQALAIKQNVEHFHGVINDPEYLFIEDALVKLNMKLDAIQSNGNETIKEERKNTVHLVENCLKMLDARTKQDN